MAEVVDPNEENPARRTFFEIGFYKTSGRLIRKVLCSSLFALALGVAVAAELTDDQPISPVPVHIDLDPRKVTLGRRLFADSRMSGNNRISCASCHQFDQGLTDGLAISRGLAGSPGNTNTLTLFNVGLNGKYNWDGRFSTLAEQTEGVMASERTMGAKWENVIALLEPDASLKADFDAIYSDGLQRKNVIDVIVEFEKSLITPNAPFDRFLRGDSNAISPEALAGYKLFKAYGCISCHQGVNVGGNMLQVFGIFGMPKAAARGADTLGSAQNSGIDSSRPVFRVPSLRNVEHTAPYFHDGSVATLSEAIELMAEYQLGRQIDHGDVIKLEAFLNSLSGEYDGVSLGDLK